ncbi:hypothetical protein EBQ91_05635 [bacterium]|nr:hypothetical protein [bacterium]
MTAYADDCVLVVDQNKLDTIFSIKIQQAPLSQIKIKADTMFALVDVTPEEFQLLKNLERSSFREDADLFNKIQSINEENYKNTGWSSKEAFALKNIIAQPTKQVFGDANLVYHISGFLDIKSCLDLVSTQKKESDTYSLSQFSRELQAYCQYTFSPPLSYTVHQMTQLNDEVKNARDALIHFGFSKDFIYALPGQAAIKLNGVPTIEMDRPLALESRVRVLWCSRNRIKIISGRGYIWPFNNAAEIAIDDEYSVIKGKDAQQKPFLIARCLYETDYETLDALAGLYQTADLQIKPINCSIDSMGFSLPPNKALNFSLNNQPHQKELKFFNALIKTIMYSPKPYCLSD